MSEVSTGVQKAIAHNVCGAPPVKLSKGDWKPYAAMKQILQIEHKLAKENAETNGWDVVNERAAVTEQFCAAVTSDDHVRFSLGRARYAPVKWTPEIGPNVKV